MGLSWSQLSQNPGPGQIANAMWLMQDGSVLVNLAGGTQLMALRPDGQGSYANGSWTDEGNFLLEKDDFASAVLSDGRLLTCGGEHIDGSPAQAETNFCEIYDPGAQSSTQLSAPPDWDAIGDSPSVVLNDGTFLLGNTQDRRSQVALLDPSTLTWTFGGGDNTDEQGYTLLQTGDVIRAGVYDQTSMRYDPGVKAFVPDAPLPVMLGADAGNGGNEIGPGITLMDGRVIWFGATGHTCIYTPGAEGNDGTWVQGPDLPTTSNQLVTSDAPAILEPNGKILLVVATNETTFPFALLEYDPVLNAFFTVDNAPPGATLGNPALLLLPNGHGLVSFNDGTWYDAAFTPGGNPSWAPTITSFPGLVAGNSTVTLAGTQLCGLSECYSFGDDSQQAENYPMVRFVDSGGGVTYARAHDVSTRSIAPGEPGTVLVDIPISLAPATGAPATYSVQVVAMGIPSGQDITVNVLPQTFIPPGVTSIDVSPNVLWSGQNATGTVTLNEPATPGDTTVTLSILNGAGLPAPPGVFINPPTSVVISAGDTFATFSITASATATTASTWSIVATGPDGSSQATTITVLPGQIFVSVSAEAQPLLPDQTATGAILVRTPPVSAIGEFITLSTNHPEAVSITPPDVNIRHGSTSGTFTVTANRLPLGISSVTGITISASFASGSATSSPPFSVFRKIPQPPPPPPHGPGPGPNPA
jgi:hypothetical protein